MAALTLGTSSGTEDLMTYRIIRVSGNDVWSMYTIFSAHSIKDSSVSWEGKRTLKTYLPFCITDEYIVQITS